LNSFIREHPFVACIRLASFVGAYVISNELASSKDVSRTDGNDGMLDGFVSSAVAARSNFRRVSVQELKRGSSGYG